MVKFSVESIEQVALRFLRARQFDNAKSTLLLEVIRLLIQYLLNYSLTAIGVH